MANQILKYTSKDYDSIKSDLVSAISSLTSTWTSREDGDPGIVLVKLMSALGDMLSFNFDKQALEYYAPTVTQRKNAEKLFGLIGYKMHWYRAATTTITLTNLAPLQEYIYYCKRVYDVYQANLSGESIDDSYVDIFYDYRTRYDHDMNDTGTNIFISVPPITTTDASEIPLPNSMISAGVQRPKSSAINTQPIDKTDSSFIEMANGWFADSALLVYSYWKKDNVVGLHTYLNDRDLSLSVYSREYGNIPYSLIPTTVNPGTVQGSGEYNPTIELLPYESYSFKAIQGSLKSITFSGNRLNNNRYYVPDASLDETYMYLSYKTSENGIETQTPIFIEKTDNLLTVTNFNNSDGTTKIYFQFAIDEFDYPYIELSSYWSDQLSADSVTFTFYYFKTIGSLGNITTNYLSQLNTPMQSSVSVTNLENTDYVVDADGNYLCSPGKNPQTAQEAYVESINYVMTYDTLVTIYDFTRFARRVPGISNAFACDGQYANDINKQLLTLCNSYTKQQLLDILGENADDSLTQLQLATILYNIKKVTYDYKDAPITVSDSQNPQSQQSFKNYGLNIYPIWGNFDISDAAGDTVANYTNVIDQQNPDVTAPYMLYYINTQDNTQSGNPNDYKIETLLDNYIDETRIVNVRPEYTALRVFPWRCCGTLHLTQTVTPNDVKNILNAVINTLSNTYRPKNMQFGKKLTYMEVIETVLSSDPRIRYFDAGIGTTKLISFQPIAQSSAFYDTEAYFNPISIMRYVQTYQELIDETSPYYNMICVDPSYIQDPS